MRDLRREDSRDTNWRLPRDLFKCFLPLHLKRVAITNTCHPGGLFLNSTSLKAVINLQYMDDRLSKSSEETSYGHGHPGFAILEQTEEDDSLGVCPTKHAEKLVSAHLHTQHDGISVFGSMSCSLFFTSG